MARAQSISINTIIVAAIALMVLVLIIIIFTTNITNWRTNANLCESNGGRCLDSAAECVGEYQTIRLGLACLDENRQPKLGAVCCVTT